MYMHTTLRSRSISIVHRIPPPIVLFVVLLALAGCQQPLEPDPAIEPAFSLAQRIKGSRPPQFSIESNATKLHDDPRQQFRGFDLASDRIAALKPLVHEILRDYRNPKSNLDRARAIRDWVARIAVHPFPPLHPDESTPNIEVLPRLATWADVNALYNEKFDEDSRYWHAIHFQGDVMLDRLLGTLDARTGTRANDGMMEHVRGSHYRIRDIRQYRYVLCSYQDAILTALWAAAGLHGMLISTNGHDPAAVFIPELGKWVYEDPTFNEGYHPIGIPNYAASPTELLEVSHRGLIDKLRPTLTLGPRWSLEPYISPYVHVSASYFGMLGRGMTVLGSKLNSDFKDEIKPYDPQNVQIVTPGLSAVDPFNNPNAYIHVADPTVAFPLLGAHVAVTDTTESAFVVALSTNVPNHERFERRVNGSRWTPVATADTIPFGSYKVEYSSLDNAGVRSMVSRIALKRD